MGLFATKSNEMPAGESSAVNRAVESASSPPRIEAPAKPVAIVDHNKDMAWHEVAKAKRKLRSPLGIQGKLLLAFFALMSAALAVTCVIYSDKVHDYVGQQLRNQAATIAQGLAQATLSDFRTRDLRRVGEVGQRLVGTSDVVAVVFHDASGTVVTSNTRCNTPFDVSTIDFSPAVLAKVEPCVDPRLGELYRVTVPVLSPGSHPGEGILGYVTVAVSRAGEADLGVFLTKAVVAVGAVMMLVAMPLAWLLLRSTFKPVNDLVASTKQIIGGDLDTFVPVRGNDAVAQLAKSFNELVNWVKQHRAQIDAANKMLEEANHELERKIEHRTVQLEASNSRLSNEIAEKEDFLRAISHDLNAPLRNIGGTVAMLMMKHKAQCTPEMIEKLERVKRNVEIQTDLINELLELSRIKTRRATMELVEMEAIIWDLRGLFDNDLKSKGIELIIDSSLPTLWAEKARVRQVFQNLVDNAIKYMGDRPVREIHVGCRVRVTEAEFYVKDTGSGIHPDDLDKVFFVFRRGKSEVAQKVAGKGVGLASVKSIVENYSGKIWVESQLDQGTTFYFTINGKYVPSVSGQSIEELRRLQQKQTKADEESAQPAALAA